jgi:hypothetical protein
MKSYKEQLKELKSGENKEEKLEQDNIAEDGSKNQC